MLHGMPGLNMEGPVSCHPQAWLPMQLQPAVDGRDCTETEKRGFVDSSQPLWQAFGQPAHRCQCCTALGTTGITQISVVAGRHRAKEFAILHLFNSQGPRTLATTQATMSC